MPDLQKAIGATIRGLRRRRGLTLKELADDAGVSVVYLGEIERGKKYPSGQVIERLATSLRVGMPDLLERVADQLRDETSTPVRAIGFRLAGPSSVAARQRPPHRHTGSTPHQPPPLGFEPPRALLAG